jgi:hypothetical protein
VARSPGGKRVTTLSWWVRIPCSGQAQCTSRRDFAPFFSSTHRAFHGDRAGKSDRGGLGNGCEIRSAKTRHNTNCIKQGNIKRGLPRVVHISRCISTSRARQLYMHTPPLIHCSARILTALLYSATCTPLQCSALLCYMHTPPMLFFTLLYAHPSNALLYAAICTPPAMLCFTLLYAHPSNALLYSAICTPLQCSALLCSHCHCSDSLYSHSYCLPTDSALCLHDCCQCLSLFMFRQITFVAHVLVILISNEQS